MSEEVVCPICKSKLVDFGRMVGGKEVDWRCVNGHKGVEKCNPNFDMISELRKAFSKKGEAPGKNQRKLKQQAEDRATIARALASYKITS